MPEPADPKTTSQDALRLVEEAWSHAAGRYRSYWSVQLKPFLQAAVEAFQPPAEGALVIPGCGPGDEVILLSRKFPGRTLLATDLSPGMVALARQRVREAGLTNVLVAQDDAAQVSARIRRAAGIFSSFILQILPDPLAALADWALALRAGGSMVLLFWPRALENGPFFRLQKLFREKTGDERPEWEEPALQALPQFGLNLLGDRKLLFDMVHDSPEGFWQNLVEGGPLQIYLRRLGPTLLEEIRGLWIKDHGLEQKDGRWVDRPPARLWILERVEAEFGQH